MEKKFFIRNFSVFLLTASPWPFLSSLAALFLLFGFAGYLNFYSLGPNCLIAGFLLVCISFWGWCRDLIRELTFLQRTSPLIEKCIEDGFILFIVSEVLLFFSFFWAFFHASIEPAIQLGCQWPPAGIAMNSNFIPFVNCLILITSGFSVTWAQYGILLGNYEEVSLAFLFVFLYTACFLLFQFHEYSVAFHQVNDSVFGSSLYILTVFHGGHVLIGGIFLFVCLMRFYLGHLSPMNVLTLTLAGWYWHFVDIVWIAVFGFIYWWGTSFISKNPEYFFFFSIFMRFGFEWALKNLFFILIFFVSSNVVGTNTLTEESYIAICFFMLVLYILYSFYLFFCVFFFELCNKSIKNYLAVFLHVDFLARLFLRLVLTFLNFLSIKGNFIRSLNSMFSVLLTKIIKSPIIQTKFNSKFAAFSEIRKRLD